MTSAAENRSPSSQGTGRDRCFQHIENPVEIPKARHPGLDRNIGGLGEKRGLDTARRKKQPLQITPARRITERRRESGLRNRLRDIGANRAGFGDGQPIRR